MPKEETSKEPKTSTNRPFAENETKVVSNNILGKLLSFLRQKNHISLLSACREIQSIRVLGQTAHIGVQTQALADILKFEKNAQILLAFFKKKGLTYVVEHTKDTSLEQIEQTLNMLFGKYLKCK